MDTPQDRVARLDADRCAKQRAAVKGLCDDARQAQAGYVASTEQARQMRRDLVAAQHDRSMAEATAEPQLRVDEKARARELYEHARTLAVDEAETAEATANWARALDRINRAGRLAARSVSRARAATEKLEGAMRVADRAEQSARMTAEAAEAACLDARVRLANCEEQAQPSVPAAAVASPSDPHVATGGHAVAVPNLQTGEPLVIEALLSGDRQALELTSALVAEHTGLQRAEANLQLQELIDAIVSVAISEGYLLFDGGHPFWAHLSVEEARDVVAALARLGFQFEPAEGWHAGRAPTPMDLSMALAYAGLDARSMRDLPDTDELRSLPQSITVDARSFLAAVAPDLTVDHMVGVLDRRAKPLEPLWNEWGQIRPILLSNRSSLRESAG
ncbi:MAG: hypothetical protein ACC726_06305 [Chloroflexota bacterium]